MLNILKILLIIVSLLACTNEHPRKYNEIISKMNKSYNDNYLFDSVKYTQELFHMALSDTNCQKLENFCKNMIISNKTVIRIFYLDFTFGYSYESNSVESHHDKMQPSIGITPTILIVDKNGNCGIYEIKYEYNISGDYVPTVKDTVVKNCKYLITILTKSNLDILNNQIKELGFPIFISIYHNNEAFTVLLRSKPIYDYMDNPSPDIIDLSEKLRIIIDLSFGEWDSLKKTQK